MWRDGWTVVTKDRRWTAQFEHTIVVTDDGSRDPDPAVRRATPPSRRDHHHADVSGGWLRPAVVRRDGRPGHQHRADRRRRRRRGGAARRIVLTGVAGLVAGAISMGLGEYTSVRTPERAGRRRGGQGAAGAGAATRRPRPTSWPTRGSPAGCRATWPAQVADVLQAQPGARRCGCTPGRSWASTRTSSPARGRRRSPRSSASRSGALIPLLPYLLGFDSLWLALGVGGVGLFVAGALVARFTGRRVVDQRPAPARARRGGGRRDLRHRRADRGHRELAVEEVARPCRRPGCPRRPARRPGRAARRRARSCRRRPGRCA